MASILFVDYSTTIPASWLNQADYIAWNDKVRAFAGLTVTADRLPYFTSSSGDMSVAIFPPFARTLVAAATAAIARSVLSVPATAANAINIMDYVTSATAGVDNTVQIKTAMLAAQASGRALYVPAGVYRNDGVVLINGVGLDLTIIGDGARASVFLDNYAGGDSYQLTTSFLAVHWRDIGFRLNVSKPLYSTVCFNQISGTSSSLEGVCFEGSSLVSRSLLRLTNTYQVSFFECLFENHNGIGALEVRSDSVNSSNLQFFGGTFYACRCAALITGSATYDSVSFIGTKFIGSSGNTDHKQGAVTGTAGAMTVNIGTGFTVGGYQACFIGNEALQAEVVSIVSYVSGTGVATLAQPLRYNWSGTNDIICGELGLVTAFNVTNLVVSGCHFENNAPILWDTPAFNVFGNNINAVVAAYLGMSDTHGIYVGGSNCVGGAFSYNTYSTDHAGSKILEIIHPSGGPNVPCDIEVRANTALSGGGAVLIADPVTSVGSVQYFTREAYLLKGDNLSGLGNTATSRTNLGLGTLATQSGTFSGTSSGVNSGDQTLGGLGGQPLDATLTALAGANWAADALPIGSGADTVAQVAFAANTFPAKSSAGALVAKTLTDFMLTVLDDTSAAIARNTLAINPCAVPGGRLTLTSGLPVTSADVTSSTSVYYTPYVSNVVILWDGTYWVPTVFTEQTLALGSVTAALPYDVFAFLNAGALNIEKLAWTSATARATAISLQDGRYCKTGDKTRLYLGTFYTISTTATADSGGTAGTSSVGGQRFLWNMYNRVNRDLRVVDTTFSWSYTTNTVRQARATAGNRVECVLGLAEDSVRAAVYGTTYTTGHTSNAAYVSVGLDSTTVGVGNNSGLYFTATETVGILATQVRLGLVAEYNGIPAAGYHAFNWLECGGDVSCNFYGLTDPSIRSGMIATIRA